MRVEGSNGLRVSRYELHVAGFELLVMRIGFRVTRFKLCVEH